MAKGVGRDEKVAGHQDPGVGDVDHGVASGVAEAEEADFDFASPRSTSIACRR